MYHLVLLLAAAALLGGSCRSVNINRHMKLLADMENHIESDKEHISHTKRFVTLTRKPPSKIVHHAGQTLELTCEALGSPAPSIHWFKDDVPIYTYELESSSPLGGRGSSVGRVSSSLLLARAAGPAQYSCRARAGARAASASTAVYPADGSTDVPERSKLVPLAPRILVSYKVYVDTMGSNIVLPCRVKGHPKPSVTWKNNNGTVIKTDPRMKVLRSGELVISALQWGDMGEFTCRASNIFGTSEIKTFVYPARPNESDG